MKKAIAVQKPSYVGSHSFFIVGYTFMPLHVYCNLNNNTRKGLLGGFVVIEC